jgi:hypothetical protein
MQPGAFSSFMDPRVVISHFHLRPGDAVADFGAGSGQYLKALSTAVSSSGTVYACEIQKSLVEKLTTRIHDERLSNVHAVWCDFEALGGTKLRDGLLDAGMLHSLRLLVSPGQEGNSLLLTGVIRLVVWDHSRLRWYARIWQRRSLYRMGLYLNVTFRQEIIIMGSHLNDSSYATHPSI